MNKIRRSAKGEDCTVMVYGVCNHNPETTVLAHLNGGGMGAKNSDLFGCYACSDCHAWLDYGYAKNATREERDLEHLKAVIRTQGILLKKGLIEI